MAKAQSAGLPVTTNYLKICSDIGCNPIPELLTSLSAGHKNCCVSSPNEILPDTQVIALCAVLPLSIFEELVFSNLQLSINSWVAIADACSKTKSLQRLSFRECNFKDGHGAPSLARALGGADLQQLEVLNSRLGDDFIAALAEGPMLRSDKLQVLRLVGCGITCDGACRLSQTIESVGMMSSLRVLDLSGNRLCDRGACALAAMLISEGASSSVPLNTLDLENNQISDIGGLALCKAAKAALVLVRLNLSHNMLTDASMTGLTEAIRFNTGTLKEVAIAGCKATEDTAMGLIKAVMKNNTIQMLDIRGVALGVQGVSVLCQMLRYTSSLITLRVDVAGSEGAHMIARELPSNRSLMHITLGGPVPEGLLTQMSEILSANTLRSMQGSPARASPHIHAWIEDSTNAYRTSAQRSRSSSPAPGDYAHPQMTRSPRSEAGNSTYSHATHATNKTARTQRTARSNTTYQSFGNMTDISRRTVMVGSNPLRISASLAAGGAAEKAAAIFRNHDQNQDNHLNRQEMLQALEEMGVMHGIKARHIGRYLDSEFKKADWDKDGKISLQDFVSYYERIAHFQGQMAREGRIKSMANLNKQMMPAGAENNPQLKKLFKSYCKVLIGQGRTYDERIPQMNTAQFHRLCQDAHWVEPEGRLSTTAIDVIWYRYRPSTSRRLGFKEFIEVLVALAYEMGAQVDELLETLGCRPKAQLATQESMGDSVSEAGTMPSPRGAAAPEQLVPDPSFNVLVPLATVHEGHEGQARQAVDGIAAAKAKVGLKKATKPNSKNSKVSATNPAPITNPLYESQDHAPHQPITTSFNAAGSTLLRSGAASQQQRPTSPGAQTRPGSVTQPGIDAAVIEARLRMEFGSQIAALEDKVLALSRAGASTPGDAMQRQDLNTRLRHMETQIADALLRQEELDNVSRQMQGLQDILQRLAEEIMRIKTVRESNGGNGAAEVAGLGRDVADLREAVSHWRDGLGREVSGLSSKMEGLQLQVRGLSAASGGSGGGAGNGSGGLSGDVLASLEKRMIERQSRYEGALMQVAKQVDSLDQRLKEEQSAHAQTLATLAGVTGGNRK